MSRGFTYGTNMFSVVFSSNILSVLYQYILFDNIIKYNKKIIMSSQEILETSRGLRPGEVEQKHNSKGNNF